MSYNGRLPAFARPVSEDRASGDQPDGNDTIEQQDGLTKRELLAALTLQGILASGTWVSAFAEGWQSDPAKQAKLAVSYADALLEELNR